MRNRQLEVRPVVGSIGAEIHGVDIAGDLDDGTIAQIREALLDHGVIFFRFLFEAGHRPEFTRSFRWELGSVAFWDNRCTRHLAVHDAGPYRRLMRRVQLVGDRPC